MWKFVLATVIIIFAAIIALFALPTLFLLGTVAATALALWLIWKVRKLYTDGEFDEYIEQLEAELDPSRYRGTASRERETDDRSSPE